MEHTMKLNAPRPSVEQATAQFEARRQRLLMATAGGDRVTGEEIADPRADIYGNRAIASLVLGRFAPEANARLRRTAEWFDHPHPSGRTHDGECDFAAMKLCRAFYLFRNSDRLGAETREAIRRFFLTRDFASRHHSENHELLFRTSRYLRTPVRRGGDAPDLRLAPGRAAGPGHAGEAGGGRGFARPRIPHVGLALPQVRLEERGRGGPKRGPPADPRLHVALVKDRPKKLPSPQQNRLILGRRSPIS